MTSADVRARLTHALRLDLIGPEPGEPQASEILNPAPSRWYLTGFLVPWDAPASQKRDEDDAQGELEIAEASSASEEDQATPEPPAARRGHFPSSLGVSVLVPKEAVELRITARWGDYEPLEADGKPTGEWRRHERQQTVAVELAGDKAEPATVSLLEADDSTPQQPTGCLEVVTSVRRIRRPEDLPGLPAGTRAVSVFLVNRREPIAAQSELKDTRFAFQARLTVEADQPFVPRPNPRGREASDPDERVADLQYRDAMEFAVGHGTATRSIIANRSCRRVETTWMPQAEVERVEPAPISNVELQIDALAAAPDAAAVKGVIEQLPVQYRVWIEAQRGRAPKGGPQREVAESLIERAIRAAKRIEDGVALLDAPLTFEAFRLANRAMAMAARQRRAQERRVDVSTVEPPAWRPFQLAFLLMNLRAFATPTHPDRELVDLLFFPTGGGKTEAYLGLSAFAAAPASGSEHRFRGCNGADEVYAPSADARSAWTRSHPGLRARAAAPGDAAEARDVAVRDWPVGRQGRDA
jgi:hypothetical protein